MVIVDRFGERRRWRVRRLTIAVEQRVDFPAKPGVAGAGAIEKSQAFGGGQIQSGVERLLDALKTARESLS